MTLRALIEEAGKNPALLAGIFVSAPVLTWLMGLIHGKDRGALVPWKYGYSVLVYWACIPGIFAAMLTVYALFFRKENLLDVNLLVYALPVVSMIVTLGLIRQRVDFKDVPGFDRLSGLMVMIACSLALALAIQKTRILIIFGGPVQQLVIIFVAVFALLKWGAYMVFRRRDEPAKEMPTLGK